MFDYIDNIICYCCGERALFCMHSSGEHNAPIIAACLRNCSIHESEDKAKAVEEEEAEGTATRLGCSYVES